VLTFVSFFDIIPLVVQQGDIQLVMVGFLAQQQGGGADEEVYNCFCNYTYSDGVLCYSGSLE
jgi:hypothetical protein